MSHLLWKYYWENDVDKFRRLLAPAGPNNHTVSKSPALGNTGGYLAASPGGGFATSPRPLNKSRKASGNTPGKAKDGNYGIGKNEINSRDHAGLTVLLRAASSTGRNAPDFVQALVDHPAIDLYVQDPESGWNALHRSLYFGNISVARMLLAKERADLTNHTLLSVSKVGLLIKTKDNEGNSPFDLYSSTVATRSLKKLHDPNVSDSASDSEDSTGDIDHVTAMYAHPRNDSAEGDELFVFGSNKNCSLGVGDEDDRQYPERLLLQRPDHLIHRFYESYLDSRDMETPATLPDLEQIPVLVRNRPLVIQDVVMSKLHTAVLTTDPMSNLYVSGVGRGGRLGLGDENTQYKFMPVQGALFDKKTHQVALGQNHSMAVVGNGELWTWGLNSDSQLGYILPPPMRADEEPMSLVPRQIFGSLKKEIILGVAASSVHSVAHTGSSLFCWGRNTGQLALMDADSRSLEIQQTPRKVAASLLSAPIEMVSAIDKATTCLLSNCSVWVFTNYGYNLVKFPFPDVFSNHNLTNTSFSTRYDPGRKDIRYITSGGETIAAVTARGDLFTMQLNHKSDISQPASSTTNPAKIKGAVTQPQCIWDSRKDGVASVSVGEHGSVIICTESGAVWRRVKRVKSKIAAFAGSVETKRKDFKFQRVPYITNCVTVKSSMFGAFAAIRKDSKVMSEEISIGVQSLWEDVASLSILSDFTPSKPTIDIDDRHQKWTAAVAREKPGSIPHAILSSPNVEEDLSRWLQRDSFQYEDRDVYLCSASSTNIELPVHGWLLCARSSILRQALCEVRQSGNTIKTEVYELSKTGGRCTLTLHADIYTVVNILVYLYHDAIVPVWKYTRESPTMASRFRQIRNELMRISTVLNMPNLETAARLQSSLEPSLDADFREATSDPLFFEDADMVIELDGTEVPAHSQLICRRCPFFEGMFNGRSQGQWLADRRSEALSSDLIRVDLKHIQPETFDYVLNYIYADVGPDIFSPVQSPSVDEFSELVLDVMSAANELMLDRLSQICQFLIGKFVSVRNIANLLNEISPCSVTDFKDIGLEYICLQLEGLLENHLLDGLDEDLLQELDDIVQDNQLARLPFAKSSRAELLLHERHPDLALDIEEERRRRVKMFASKFSNRDDDRKLSSSYRARFGSLDEASITSPTPDATRHRYKGVRNEPFSPSLRPKASQGDLMFEMDEEASPSIGATSSDLASPEPNLDLDGEQMPRLPDSWRGSASKAAESSLPPLSSPFSQEVSSPLGTTVRANPPWASATLPLSKVDMKGIMSEASSTSALTASLAQASKEAAPNKSQTKMSQKERKRQMQRQVEAQAAEAQEQIKATPWETVSDKRPAPWKATTAAPTTSLKEAMESEASPLREATAKAKPLVAAEAHPHLSRTRTASPDTRFSGQGRTNSSPAVPSATEQAKKPVVPHSKSYMMPTPKTERMYGASMEDIIGQQRREQELVKEAIAKRPLEEIQQEQAFQEWWDQESQRAQEEEARRQNRGKGREDSARRGRRGKAGNVKKGGETGEGASSNGQKASGGPSRGGKNQRGKTRKN